jgi:CPA1 family monovalent cation:H+ antiporter
VQVAALLVLAVVVVAVGAAAARRLRVPAPLLLTLVGIALSFVPFVPQVRLQPEVVLVGLLPPLLYAAAIRTSLVDFSRNRRAIGLLSVGLVLFSTAGVGLLVWWLLPVPLAAALALGAVVAPPDAVAATAIARRVGLPRRIVTILEGESLVNDATALVCLRTAIVAMSGAVSVLQVGWLFLLAAGGGLVVGLVVATGITWVRRRIETPVLDSTLSLVAPFIAYLPAEAVGGSGVLAVVVTGLVLGHRAQMLQSAASRLAEKANWHTVQFVLENTVFLLIGLQVRWVLQDAAAAETSAGRTALVCLAVLVAVVLLRPLWVFPATYLPRLLPAVARAEPPPPPEVPAVISWAGMRGVVTLAAAFALPEATPHRAVLVLAALVVAAGTLLLQGFTLPAVVRWLPLSAPDPGEDALIEATVLQQAHEAGERRLDELVSADDPPDVVQRLRQRIRERTDAAWERLGRGSALPETPSNVYVRLRLAMLEAERETLLRLRDSGTVPYDVLRRVQAALDVEESMLDRLSEPGTETRDDESSQLVLPEHDSCEHLDVAGLPAPPDDVPGCPACLALGERTWVHLRMCVRCGAVGCCDSSPRRHADAHFRSSGHPVMRSIEPGEGWRWCFVDRLVG